MRPTSNAEDAPGGGWGKRRRILIVEDDVDMQEFLTLLLGDTYELFVMPSAEEALALAREKQPDALLLDVYLPGMDGIACLHQLRRDARTADIPAILISAEANEDLRLRSFEEGAADYLAKPFLTREFVARVEKAIREAEERRELWRLATTDGLTGLANLRFLRETLAREIERVQRYGEPLTLIMIDMDGLKEINDRLGHEAGNEALRALATKIRTSLRSADFAARFGGDEFAILLPHSDAAEGERLAERLRLALGGERQGPLPLRASFGVASVDGTIADADALFEAADRALYEAKRTGKDRVVIAGRED